MEQVTLASQFQTWLVIAAVITPLALIVTYILRSRWLGSPRLPGHALGRTLLWQAAWGAGTALAALGFAVLPALLLGHFSKGTAGWALFKYPPIHSGEGPGLLAGMFVVQSLAEEALFRGVGTALLGMLLLWLAGLVFPVPRHHSSNAQVHPRRPAFSVQQWYWGGLAAVAAVAIAFGVVHATNSNVSLLGLLNVVLAGFWLGWLYWVQGNLAGAWAGHAAWNIAVALLGLPISGSVFTRDPLGSWGIDGAVPGIISGGAFGPEGSIFCTLALLVLNALLVRRTYLELTRLRRAEDASWWQEVAVTEPAD